MTTVYMNVFENMIVLSLVYSCIIYMKCVALFSICSIFYNIYDRVIPGIFFQNIYVVCCVIFICSIVYNILRLKAFQIKMYLSLNSSSSYTV